MWRIEEDKDKLVLDEDLWERFGWTTATKVTSVVIVHCHY